MDLIATIVTYLYSLRVTLNYILSPILITFQLGYVNHGYMIASSFMILLALLDVSI